MGRVRDPILKALDDLITELGNLRIEAQRIKRLVLERFGREFEDKTPVRPQSQSAMEAFKSSQDFSQTAAETLSRKKKEDR